MTTLSDQLEALVSDPQSIEALDLARAAAQEAGAFSDFAEALRARAERLVELGAAEAAVDTLVEIALLFEEVLEDLEAAAECYQRVLEINPAHRRGLFALGLVLHDLQRWEDLIALYRRRLEDSPSDGERTTLHLYIAELLSERLDQPDAALTEVMTAARLAPQNIRIIGRLEELGERVDRNDEVAVTIGELIMHQGDQKIRAAMSLRLAELYLGPLNDHQRALAHLRAALADDGGNPEILSGVEDVFRERDRFDELANVLEESAKDRRIGPHRVRLERELARIYELELDDMTRAMQALDRAVRQAPDDRELLDEVMRVGLIGGQLDAVAETYESVVAQTQNPLLQTYMRLKLGHIYANVLDRSDDAVRVFKEILSADPTHREAAKRLAKIYERRGDVDAADEVLRALDPEAAAEVEETFADPDEEIPEISESALEAIVIDPVEDDPLALVGVSAVATMDEAATEFDGAPYGPESETQWNPEIVSSVSIALSTPDDPQGEAVVSVPEGPIEEEISAEPSRAIPAAPPPPPPDAIAAPPPAVSPEPPAPPVDPAPPKAPPPPPPVAPPPPPAAAPPIVAPSLEALPRTHEVTADEAIVSEASGQMEPAVNAAPLPRAESIAEEAEVIDEQPADQSVPPGPPAEVPVPTSCTDDLVLDDPVPASVAVVPPGGDDRIAQIEAAISEAEASGNVEALAGHLREMVAACEESKQHERAFFAIVPLTRLDPSPQNLDRLIAIGRRAQGYPLLFDTVESVTKELGESTQIEYGLRLAEIQLFDLEAPGEAVVRFDELLQIATEDERALLDRMLAMLETGSYVEEQASLLLRRARAVRDARVQGELTLRAAALIGERSNDPSTAADALLEFLQKDPTQDPVRARAIQYLEASGRFDDLLELMSAGLGRLEGAEKAEARLFMADVLGKRLGRTGEAQEMLREGIAERATDARLLQALQEMVLEEENWEDLLDVRMRLLEAATTPDARGALRLQIADLAEHQLGRPALALDMLQRTIDEQGPTLEIIGRIEAIHREREDWEGLIEALCTKADLVDGGASEASARLLVEAARLHVERRFDLETAEALLDRALTLAPRLHDGLGFRAQIREEQGDFAGAIEALQQLAAVCQVEEEARVYVQIGRILSERFRDDAAAQEQYEAALAVDPGCLDALRALIPVVEQAQDFARARDLAARAADATDDAREKSSMWCLAGQLADEKLSDALLALEHYKKALEVDAEDLAVRAKVGEILLERGEHEEAYAHLAQAASELSDPQRAGELHRSAGVAALGLDQLDVAGAAFEQALQTLPSDRTALERLSEVLEKQASWDRAYEVSALLVLHHETSLPAPQASAVFLRMAKAKRHANDQDATLRLARRAHELDPQSVESARLLADSLAKSGASAEAAEALRTLAHLLEEPEARKQALLAGGRLLADASDVARASAMLAEAQQITPNDAELGRLLSDYRLASGEPFSAQDALVLPAQNAPPLVKAGLLHRAAQIALGPGRDRAKARRLLEEALEADPAHAGALEDLQVVLEYDGDLSQVAAVTERAAQVYAQSEGGAGRAQQAYEAAMDLYRFRLDAPERALAICRKLRELDHEHYAEDYARLLDWVASLGSSASHALRQEAINAWGEIVERTPGYIEGLTRLQHLRRAVGDDAAARVLGEVLSAMGHATPTNGTSDDLRVDTRVVELAEAVKIPPSDLEESPIKVIFNGLGYAPLKALSDVLGPTKLRKKDQVGAAALGIHVSRPLQYAVRLLGMPEPLVFVDDAAVEVMKPTFVGDQPGVIVSLQKAKACAPVELRFIIGRTLSLTRPRALALAVLPLGALREALVGFAKIEDPSVHFVDAKLAKRRGRALEKALPQAARARLTDLIRAWLDSEGRRTLGKERAAVRATADRTGLVVSQSLVAAMSVLSSWSEGTTDPTWVLPLLAFASTRDFADLVR